MVQEVRVRSAFRGGGVPPLRLGKAKSLLHMVLQVVRKSSPPASSFFFFFFFFCLLSFFVVVVVVELLFFKEHLLGE